MKGIKLIEELPIFSGVRTDTLEQLLKTGRIQEYEKNTIFIRAREKVGCVYFQLTGKSMVYNLTHNGKRKVLFIFGQGELLNEHVFNIKVSSTYCETVDKSKILVVPCGEFIKLMAEDFALTSNILEAQEKKIWRLSHQLKNTTSSIYFERKLAAKLWKLSRDFGKETEEGLEIDMNMTITLLADMLGAPRETTSRACSVLTDHGLIRLNKKRIVITDPKRMSHFYKTGEIK